MSTFFATVFLAIALEGAVYALFPRKMKAMLAQIEQLPVSALQVFGVVALGVGVLGAWLIR